MTTMLEGRAKAKAIHALPRADRFSTVLRAEAKQAQPRKSALEQTFERLRGALQRYGELLSERLRPVVERATALLKQYVAEAEALGLLPEHRGGGDRER